MKHPVIILLFLCAVSACHEKPKMPPGILPINRMKAIVWDMEMADQQALDRFTLSKDSMRMEATSLYQQVFATHKINKAGFYKSFSYYESQPELLKTLFDSVSEYGNRQKTVMYKKAY